MYIEHTPQGYNVMGVSPELLEDIINLFKLLFPISYKKNNKDAESFVQMAENELNTKRSVSFLFVDTEKKNTYTHNDRVSEFSINKYILIDILSIISEMGFSPENLRDILHAFQVIKKANKD